MTSAFFVAALAAGLASGLAEPASQPSATLPVEPGGHPLKGFTRSSHYDEQVLDYRIEPGVNVSINAPAAAQFRPDRPIRLIFYTLPNGNTTAQTVGRKMAEGLDWHFDIQHIGAQTRLLRSIVQDANIVVVYLEADGRSWPAWKQKHADHREPIKKVLDSVRDRFKPYRHTLELSGHSGGGSFIFGLIDAADQIPADISRISFLDSNYGYSDAAGHGDKLVAWLKSDPHRVLSVICYDDRDVKLNGKPIVSATGGTYRRTTEMVERLGKDFPLARAAEGEVVRYRGLDGRVELILHGNPQGKILHTVLVGEMNGFAHAMLLGTPHEPACPFGTPRAYSRYIQPD